MRRIAILTSGGDAPGMNAAIRAATMLAIGNGLEVLGIRHGYRGLIAGEVAPLGVADVQSILREGGTILGSARCPEFHDAAVRERGRGVLAEHRVDGLVVIGGNGSLTGARHLCDPGEAERPDAVPKVAGIPASIDNDVGLTGLAIGVDTAMNTIVEACDKINDTASAHDRTFLIEVMGRDCGYLAMTSAIACGADGVVFREQQKTEDEVVEGFVRLIARAGKREGRSRSALIIKAEGVGIPIDRLKVLLDARLAKESGALAPVETRVTVLGHVVRGGRPTAFDRLLASRLARVAVRALEAGKTHRMAAWLGPQPLPAAIAERSPDDPYCFLVGLDAVIAETQAMIDGTSELVKWRVRAFEEVADVLSL